MKAHFFQKINGFRKQHRVEKSSPNSHFTTWDKSAKKVGNFKCDILNDFSTIVCEDPDSFLKTGFEQQQRYILANGV